MNSRKAIFAGVMLLACFVAAALAVEVVSYKPPAAVSPHYYPDPPGKFHLLHRLYIHPRSVFRTVKPGSTIKIDVTVKNVGNTTAVLKPRVVNVYYYMASGLPIPASWINVTPKNVTVKPGEKTDIELKITVPNNTSSGEYFCLIALTNDTFPYSPFKLIPAYIYAVSINLEVRRPPDIAIYPTYLSATVLKGKSKTMKIYVKNLGNKCYTMSPSLESPEFFSGYSKPLTKDMVSITAPKLIPPNSTAVINVTLKGVEEGQFSGKIYLNINDTNLESYMQEVFVNLNVITPPKTAYVRKINVSGLSELKVKVTVNSGYSEVRLVSPGGKEIRPASVTETVYVSRTKPGVPVKPYTVCVKTATYTASSGEKSYGFDVIRPENGTWKVCVKTVNYANIEIQKIY